MVSSKKNLLWLKLSCRGRRLHLSLTCFRFMTCVISGRSSARVIANVRRVWYYENKVFNSSLFLCNSIKFILEWDLWRSVMMTEDTDSVPDREMKVTHARANIQTLIWLIFTFLRCVYITELYCLVVCLWIPHMWAFSFSLALNVLL